MATNVTGKVTASVSANWSKDLDIGAAQATPQASVSIAFTAGSGANKIEQVGMKVGSIAASGSADIDLAGTLTDPGGDTITFSKVKALLIKNTSASGDGIEVGGTFDTWVKASGDEVKVMPGGCMLIANPTAAGFAVVADTGDVITLSNLDTVNAQTYEAIVLGEIA